MAFHNTDMAIGEETGHPRAYAKLCRDRNCVGVYACGPPYSFIPFSLPPDEIARAKQLEQVFPVIVPKARPTAKPKIFVDFLWKQLNHLGNAGFDPAVIRVDPYGNVLYFHADKASPLAWDIDHWFPLSRGGLTVPNNLRILQWQVCKRKHNKLEFLVPWWDLQLGISVNQFLSIFASSNSDFRRRGYSFLFLEGENEEIHDSQPVQSHNFPQHFVESRERFGMAAAAIVTARNHRYDSPSALSLVGLNRQRRISSAAISEFKENESPDFAINPYQAIVVARDSLKPTDGERMLAEINKLDCEIYAMSMENDEDRVRIQDLELQLLKRRRRAEKCRRLAEEQGSYKTTLEKMIRDAMHQSVVYKEQARMTQAAISALVARLEAQKATCEASEKELRKKFLLKEELETQIKRTSEHARKRSRGDEIMNEGKESLRLLYLEGVEHDAQDAQQCETRTNIEEKVRAAHGEDDTKIRELQKEKMESEKIVFHELISKEGPRFSASPSTNGPSEVQVEKQLQELELGEAKRRKTLMMPVRRTDMEEDEESRKERGKGNVERWLRKLLEESREYSPEPEEPKGHKKRSIDEILRIIDEKYPIQERGGVEDKHYAAENRIILNDRDRIAGLGSSSRSYYEIERNETKVALRRSESAKPLRRIPSSPLILGMKRGMNCIIKKPEVTGEYSDEEPATVRILGSSIKPVKLAKKL